MLLAKAIIKALEYLTNKGKGDKMISISDYELRLPKSNEKYFNNLNEAQKEEYVKLYEVYSKFLLEYLIKKYNLLKYDNIFKNSKSNFVPMPIEKIDMYQTLCRNKLNYIYIRNNIYIERLNKEEISYLYSIVGKEYNQEIEIFIAKTFKKLIIENNDAYLKINYGFNNRSYQGSSNALVIGLRYDKYVDSNNKNFEELNEQRLLEKDNIIEYIKEELQHKSNMNIEVIEYGDFSVNVMNSKNLHR